MADKLSLPPCRQVPNVKTYEVWTFSITATSR